MGNTSRKIQDYTVSDRLGGGCFGTVYKARYHKKETYAIKEIYRGKTANAVAKIQREADIHEILPYHRNIVRFIECFKQEYKMYLVLEYCCMGPLNDYVIQHELSEKTLLYIMFDLARGLQHIHRHNIVHRDIKPDNVLLNPGKFDIPTCKICDFGLARTCCKDGSVCESGGSTRAASDDGPPMYMAPEITSGSYTTKCDVFSLGVLYFALFSRQITTFKGRQLLEPHINGYPVFSAAETTVEAEVIRRMKDNCDPNLVTAMLRKDPGTRCSMENVIVKLHEIFAHASNKNDSCNRDHVDTNGHIQVTG